MEFEGYNSRKRYDRSILKDTSGFSSVFFERIKICELAFYSSRMERAIKSKIFKLQAFDLKNISDICSLIN